MTARRKAKRVRRSIGPKPPVARGRVTAGAQPRYEEATERDATKLPPLERDTDSDESTQLGALFDERSRDEGDLIVGDP